MYLRWHSQSPSYQNFKVCLLLTEPLSLNTPVPPPALAAHLEAPLVVDPDLAEPAVGVPDLEDTGELVLGPHLNTTCWSSGVAAGGGGGGHGCGGVWGAGIYILVCFQSIGPLGRCFL